MGNAEDRRRVWWVALFVIVLGAGALRVRLLDVPLERDEGEYAYAGQLLLDGVVPYEQAYNMKLPGIYAAYAVMLAVFGETREGLHVGLLVVNALTSVLVFLLGRRLLGPLAGVASAATFAVLSVGPEVQGVFGNAEHFVLPFAVGGVLLLLRALDERRALHFALAGACLGLGFVVKQHGVAFVALGALLMLLRRRRVAELAVFAGSAALPYALTCLLLYSAGVFETFWFWTMEYALEYATLVSWDQALAMLAMRVTALLKATPALWGLVALGAAALAWHRPTRRQAAVVAAFAVLSFAAVCPGLYFRPHYFVLALPAAALLAGAGVSALGMVLRPAVAVGVLALALGTALYGQREVLFELTPDQVSRKVYGPNPFPESVEVARFIAERTAPDDRVAILGSEPQILFHAHRRLASGFLYTYALMEPHPFAAQLQQQMIAEIESAEPEVLVLVNIWTSWLGRPDSPRHLIEWFETYRQGFDLVGAMTIRPEGSNLLQGADLAALATHPDHQIEIYQRR